MKKELFGSKKRIAGTVASVLVGLIGLALLAAPASPDETAASAVPSAAPKTVTVTVTETVTETAEGYDPDPDGNGKTAGEELTDAILSGEPEPEAEFGSETASQENARGSAESYLDSGQFSRSGLIDQLEYEGFSTADATYAVDALSPDWNEQAAKSAESYLDSGSFSRASLVDQLLYEGFTAAQAEYGVSTTGL